MDFCQLLHKAQKNDKNSANGVRYYSTKFEPPKKIKKEHKDLSENIKKFLAKKEAEEQKKRDEDLKKKEELLALRAQDKKATRRVNVMLKRTKSANQAVIDDAKDNTHTAVTRAGPDQPDEDDYGYVSQEASQYYEKMMERYSKMPEEPKFNVFKKKVSTNLSSTKDRVKAALEKEREEAMAPHRRKRKKKDQEGQEGDDKKDDEKDELSPEHKDSSKDSKDKEISKPKPKPRPAPPPVSFTELLKIAEKKQFEPIVIEKKVEEEERLYTKKQKKEAEKEREWREKREARRLNEEQNPESKSKERGLDREKDREKSAKGSNVPSSNKSSSKNTTSSTSDSKILERQLSKPSSSSDSKILERQLSKPSSSSDRSGDKEKIPLKQTKPVNPGSRPGGDTFRKPFSVDNRIAKSSVPSKGDEWKSTKSKESLSSNSNRQSISNGNLKSSTSSNVPDQRGSQVSSKSKPIIRNGSSVGSSKDVNVKKSEGALKKGVPPVASGKPKEFPPRDLVPKGKPKEFPPRDLKPKEFPPRDLKPKQFPPPDVRGIKRKQPMVASRGRILDDDSEEEYDSELDDFIDDGPEEDNNYSSYIKEIFGYDKSRYRGLDDDVDDMETSFAQQMKEEVISTKIGIMEDLEDMKQEEEEKRRKAMRMKKMRR